MKRIFYLWLVVAVMMVPAANAAAESIKGRVGITGQVGFLIPQDGSYTRGFTVANSLPSDKLEGDGAFAAGGGVIYGLTDVVALEAHVVYTPNIEFNNSGMKVVEIAATDVSLGIQIRNNAEKDLTAYLGGGIDVLFSDVEDARGNGGDVATVVGGHVHAGGDYFLSKRLALNLDLRGVFFPDADIKAGGVTVARYDPIAFIGLFGVRFFLN